MGNNTIIFHTVFTFYYYDYVICVILFLSYTVYWTAARTKRCVLRHTLEGYTHGVAKVVPPQDLQTTESRVSETSDSPRECTNYCIEHTHIHTHPRFPPRLSIRRWGIRWIARAKIQEFKDAEVPRYRGLEDARIFTIAEFRKVKGREFKDREENRRILQGESKNSHQQTRVCKRSVHVRPYVCRRTFFPNLEWDQFSRAVNPEVNLPRQTLHTRTDVTYSTLLQFVSIAVAEGSTRIIVRARDE